MGHWFSLRAEECSADAGDTWVTPAILKIEKIVMLEESSGVGTPTQVEPLHVLQPLR